MLYYVAELFKGESKCLSNKKYQPTTETVYLDLNNRAGVTECAKNSC